MLIVDSVLRARLLLAANLLVLIGTFIAQPFVSVAENRFELFSLTAIVFNSASAPTLDEWSSLDSLFASVTVLGPAVVLAGWIGVTSLQKAISFARRKRAFFERYRERRRTRLRK